MEKNGSQTREDIHAAGYEIYYGPHEGEIILKDEFGILELWQQNDDFAGYVIDIDGVGYEFVREAHRGACLI